MVYIVLITAVEEAKRFIKKAGLAAEWLEANDPMGLGSGNKKTATCRRASMDLTRALADLRRYPNQKE